MFTTQQKHSILFVGAHNTQLPILKRHLATREIKVIETHNHWQAMLAILSDNPDLVVLDASVDDVDALFAAIRTAHAREYLPIIVIGTLENRHTGSTAYALGVDDYMSQPFDVGRLLRSIYRLLGSDRMAITKPCHHGTILVAHSDPITAMLLSIALSELGFTVVSADNDRDVWDHLSYNVFDMIFFDVLMAGVDITAISRILHRISVATPIVAVIPIASGNTQNLVAGAETCLFTPISRARLQMVIGRFFSVPRVEDYVHGHSSGTISRNIFAASPPVLIPQVAGRVA
ncbi:MAG: response regulator [Sedimentisphaerales bacterium]|nr:response regulator [Sedimentisphaerales bacterium]